MVPRIGVSSIPSGGVETRGAVEVLDWGQPRAPVTTGTAGFRSLAAWLLQAGAEFSDESSWTCRCNRLIVSSRARTLLRQVSSLAKSLSWKALNCVVIEAHQHSTSPSGTPILFSLRSLSSRVRQP